MEQVKFYYIKWKWRHDPLIYSKCEFIELMNLYFMELTNKLLLTENPI